MSNCCDPALTDFGREIDATRRQLHASDTAVLRSDILIREHVAHVKAFAYVWVAAALEQFVNASLRSLLQELTAVAIPQQRMRTSLLSMVCFPLFDSLRDVGGLKQWERRVEVLGRSGSTDAAIFSDESVPLDGRTIRPEHFKIFWLIFGLPRDPLPSPRHALALNDLAEGRNQVAHGKETPLAFGRRRVTADILRIVDYTEDIATNTALAFDEYLADQLYLR